MAIQIPSFIQNPTTGSNPNVPLPPGGDSHPKTNPTRIVLFIISLLVIGGIVGYYFFIYSKDDTNKNTNLVVNNSNTNLNTNQNINATTEILDCENDINCLIQASENCTPAKVSHTTTIELGVQQTTTSYFELKKSDQSKCTLYLRTDKIDLVFPDSIPQETVDEQNDLYDSLQGLDGTCEFSTADLTAVLTNWKNGDLESGEVTCHLSINGSECDTIGGDFGKAVCTGTYFEKLSAPDSNLNNNENLNISVNLNDNISNLNRELNINSTQIDKLDTDGDSLTNNEEYLYGCNKDLIDTDGDGYDDYTEISYCYSPLDDSDNATLSNVDFINYCTKLLDQESIDWGIKSIDEIQNICSIYEPAAVLSFELALGTRINFSEEEYNLYLDNKCEALKLLLNQTETEEDIFCDYMSEVSKMCK